MALVRCPIHKIPYNDENPRGCPACAREKAGADQLGVMRELARASRASQATPAPSVPPEPPKKEARELPAGELWRQSLARASAITEVVEAPEREGFLGSFAGFGDSRRRLIVGWGLIAVLTLLLILTSGPRYIEAPHPPPPSAQPRPLILEPFAPVTDVFSILGPQEPQAVADAPQLARHSYGTDFYVDALNRRVYAVTLEVGSRSWRGLQVGQPERTVEGMLAMLGPVRRAGSESTRQPQEIGGYLVFPSLEERPRRTLLVEVRPPNGCFDVTVDLQPQTAGILRRGSRRYAVIGEGSDAPLTWVATRIRITTRRISGPYASVAC